MLDEKFRRVKEKLIKKLAYRELEEQEYWKAVYQCLFEEGVVEGPFENSTKEVAIRLATKLVHKLPAKEYWGLEKRYVALNRAKLSKEAQDDLRKYYELKSGAKDHLKKEIGRSAIPRSKFEKKIEKYLIGQTNLPKIASEEKQREVVIRVMTSLEQEFNVKEDSQMIGQYDIESLESALDKLNI